MNVLDVNLHPSTRQVTFGILANGLRQPVDVTLPFGAVADTLSRLLTWEANNPPARQSGTAKPPQPREIYWIDVEDHLPDDEITVLVCDVQGDMYLAYHAEGEWWQEGFNPVLGTLIGNVSYWADLPLPPTMRATNEGK
jgi:hypothetical protein